MGKRKSMARAEPHVYKKFDKTFVKIKGFPHWPARIEETSNELSAKNRYNVKFYGTNEVYIAREDMIVPYNEQTSIKYGQRKKNIKQFNAALDEIAGSQAVISSGSEVPSAKRVKLDPSEPLPESALNDSQIVVNLMNSMLKNIVAENVKKSELGLGSGTEANGLAISHVEGRNSYETFCRYLAQFDVIKCEQIGVVKDVYQSLSSEIVPKVDLDGLEVKVKEADLDEANGLDSVMDGGVKGAVDIKEDVNVVANE